MQDSAVYEQVEAVLNETSKALILKHGFDPKAHQDYVDKTLSRLSNTAIDDLVSRVGRQPLRKLSRNERLIAPAAYLASNSIYPKEILNAVSAALSFESDEDPEVEELNLLLNQKSAEEFVQLVCGIHPGHALFDPLVGTVSRKQSETRAA
jgi:mannitol-1-phosphate 5-dehydrogenase